MTNGALTTIRGHKRSCFDLKTDSTTTTPHPEAPSTILYIMPFEATTAVMDTAELREMILLQLDNKTLLLSQRVCKNFKTTIERSKDIQQKLFFRFDNSTPNLRDMMRMGQGEYANPLLTSTSPEFYRGNGKLLKIQHGDLELAIAWVTLAPRYEAQLRTFAIEMRCGVEVIGPASKEKPSEGCESWRRMCLFRPGFVGIVHLGGEILRIGEPKS